MEITCLACVGKLKAEDGVKQRLNLPQGLELASNYITTVSQSYFLAAKLQGYNPDAIVSYFYTNSSGFCPYILAVLPKGLMTGSAILIYKSLCGKNRLRKCF